VVVEPTHVCIGVTTPRHHGIRPVISAAEKVLHVKSEGLDTQSIVPSLFVVVSILMSILILHVHPFMFSLLMLLLLLLILLFLH